MFLMVPIPYKIMADRFLTLLPVKTELNAISLYLPLALAQVWRAIRQPFEVSCIIILRFDRFMKFNTVHNDPVKDWKMKIIFIIYCHRGRRTEC